MRAIEVLHKYLDLSLPELHKTRTKSLVDAVESAMRSSQLTLTQLGRSATGNAHPKHKIKRVDRLLANTQLHKEIPNLYRVITHMIIGNKKHPIISVDWASVDNRNKFHVLKACVAYQGRAITLFDQVEYKDRPKLTINNSVDNFVNTLANLLPAGCQPIIVTDAAFVSKWAKRIESQGWYWITRVRGLVKVREIGRSAWISCTNLHDGANHIPEELGEYIFTKKNERYCTLVRYKQPKRYRRRRNHDGSIKICNKKQDYSKSANEPWLLASNLPKRYQRAKKIVRCYETRMQIEEVFRDMKSSYYGLGIRHTLSNSSERVAVLVLIAALALLMLGVLGKAGYEQKLNFRFQANTIRDRKVLSLWYLGRQLYLYSKDRIPIKAFRQAFIKIQSEIITYEIL